MADIFVVIEHRLGELREISLQMLTKADELGRKLSAGVTAVLLAGPEDGFENEIAVRADRLIVCRHDRLKNYDSDWSKELLSRIIAEHQPFLTLIGHTPWGLDLAPALAVKTGRPLATDCLEIAVTDGRPEVIRQIYGGKMFSRIAFQEAPGYLIMVRPGAFPAEQIQRGPAQVVKLEVPSDLAPSRREVFEYVDSSAGEVDITQAELLVSIGRGVGDEENILLVKELADLMGGTLSCSRPVVDKHWLSKAHQVGTSGKSVKPKVYLALGISGAFQHLAGIGGAGVVLAVNKDDKAPIFRRADYGAVADLFEVIEALKEKLKG